MHTTDNNCFIPYKMPVTELTQFNNYPFKWQGSETSQEQIIL